MNQKLKRSMVIIIVGLVISFLYGSITCGWLFNWVYSLEPVNVWKPASGSFFWQMPLATFIWVIVFVLGYGLIHTGISGRGIKKGLLYGVIVWLLATVPRMVHLYVIMTVSTTVLIYWCMAELLHNLLLGAIIGFAFRNILE